MGTGIGTSMGIDTGTGRGMGRDRLGMGGGDGEQSEWIGVADCRLSVNVADYRFSPNVADCRLSVSVADYRFSLNVADYRLSVSVADYRFLLNFVVQFSGIPLLACLVFCSGLPLVAVLNYKFLFVVSASAERGAFVCAVLLLVAESRSRYGRVGDVCLLSADASRPRHPGRPITLFGLRAFGNNSRTSHLDHTVKGLHGCLKTMQCNAKAV